MWQRLSGCPLAARMMMHPAVCWHWLCLCVPARQRLAAPSLISQRRYITVPASPCVCSVCVCGCVCCPTELTAEHGSTTHFLRIKGSTRGASQRSHTQQHTGARTNAYTFIHADKHARPRERNCAIQTMPFIKYNNTRPIFLYFCVFFLLHLCRGWVIFVSWLNIIGVVMKTNGPDKQQANIHVLE